MKHVIGLSGGKDSTAMALRLAEVEPREYEYICTPTGGELPELFAHLAKLEMLLGQPIERLGCGMSLTELIDDQRMLPNFRARWCTRILKIEPTIAYMEALPAGSVLYVGLRADEPAEDRAGIFGEDFPIRFPLREWGWTEANVWRYLAERGVSIPQRTDCGLCYGQRLGEWWNLWRDHPDIFANGIDLETRWGHTFRSESRDSWPASLAELGQRFAAGDVPRGAQVNGSLFDEQTCRVCSL